MSADPTEARLLAAEKRVGELEALTMCLEHEDRHAIATSAECRECFDNRVRQERRLTTRISEMEAALRDIAWQALYQPKNVRQTALAALANAL